MSKSAKKLRFWATIGAGNRMFMRIASLMALSLLAGAMLSLSGCSSSGGGGGSNSAIPAATMRVHYYRPDGIYTNWGVYSWLGPKTPSTGWPGNRFLFTTTDADGWGKHVDIAMDNTQTTMAFLITQPNAAGTDAVKDCPNDQQATLNSTLSTTGQEIWVVSGDCTVYTQEPGKVRFSSARAIWLTSDTIVWPGASASNNYSLLVAANGGVTSSSSGASGYDNSYPLTVGSLSSTLLAKYPQYATATVLKVPASITQSQLANILTGEVAIVQNSIQNTGLTAVDGTQVQLAPVLDSLYAANAKSATLGLSFDGSDVPTFSVWAPTAQSVSLNIYDSATATSPVSTQAMIFNPVSGIWQYTAPDATWTNLKYYYTFSVKVYSRSANNAVITNTVADPYAVSLNALDSTNVASLHAMVLNLADTANMPTGWSNQVLPASLDGTDSAIYELHIRDFSVNDSTVLPASNQGKYEAFAPTNVGVTNGMKHLAALAQAGLTDVHLLPAFEFASVDEVHCNPDPFNPGSVGAALAAEMAVLTYQNSDCFNWGYDPLVYGVPEGSYSTNAGDGSARVREFRDMVMGLHSIGLRVVMDVVYNHTPASGQADVSILDKIVPGYYYRLDASGNVTNQSGAGSDIAAENAMTEKLIIDTLTRWADQYKVDGFRFDIMSLLPKQVLLDAQSALNTVALNDGRRTASGPGIYLYGEGWSESGLSFVNAQQSNMAGTGIGTFNDRLRDAVRGGGPFDSGASMVQHQGFENGLCYDNNDGTSCNTTSANVQWCDTSAMTQQQCLYLLQDRISVGLAGNLASFPLHGTTTGAQVGYFGSPTGYTAMPQENIAYISMHDNETVFDVSQYKHPIATSAADRARAQVVGLSLVALAQGVPFFQAGDDMLRSKSMDSNSYNSGDYFNLIDWSGSKNNWAVGAPPQNTGNNAANLATMTPLLNNAGLAVASADINHTTLAFQDFLRIRQDTTMFRLKTAAAINGCVSFPDQSAQQPGLIVMRISGAAGCGDQKYKSIVVLFNANKITQTFTPSGAASYVGKTVNLHPMQAAGSDSVVKTAGFASGVFSVPERTTAVFVEQ